MKWLVFIVVLVLLLAGAYYYMPELLDRAVEETATTTVTSTPTEAALAYSSDAYGISFRYPDSYALSEREITEGIESYVIMLVDREAAANVPEFSDGPASIAISVFPATTTSAETWVRESIASNFQLSRDGTLMETRVDGVPAVSYTSDGLYATDNVVLVRDSRVYMFSVGWTSRNDAIVSDFADLLSTVRFE